METVKLRIGSVVIDCDDFSQMMTFWQEALHYVPQEPPEEGWVILKDPEGRGPNLSLNLTSEGPLDQYRLHLDLYTADQEREVERLVHLGATLKRSPQKGEDFVVLADPDGNLFCVVSVARKLREKEKAPPVGPAPREKLRAHQSRKQFRGDLASPTHESGVGNRCPMNSPGLSTPDPLLATKRYTDEA